MARPEKTSAELSVAVAVCSLNFSLHMLRSTLTLLLYYMMSDNIEKSL